MKEYLVVCTSIQEKGFLKGNEFNRTIPVGLSHEVLDDGLYYKKIQLDEVEDVFCVEIECNYDGITCLCSVYKNGEVNAFWKKYSERCSFISDEKELTTKGFVKKQQNVYFNDRPVSEHIYYIKKGISINDSKLEICAYKKYVSKIASPYDMCKRKYKDKKIYMDIEFKQVYSNLLHGLKGE